MRISIALLFIATAAFAQEGSIIIKSTVNGNDVPPESVQAFVGPILGNVGSLSLMGPSMIPDDPLGMLQKKQIQEELELTKEQIVVVEELQADIQRQIAEMFSKQAGFGVNAGRMMETAAKATRENVEKELKDLLSFKQLKRLGQLEVQMKIRNRGARALTDEKLAGALEISDKQKEQIKTESRDMQKELQEEIQKLREKFRQELIQDLLNKEQLSKLEELSGSEYKVKQPNVRRWQAFQ